MVDYQKWCEDEIAIWKVRWTSYVLGKELGKIHMQDFPHAATWEDGQWSKVGGEEAVPGGHRDVTRRAAAGGICPYCGSKQVAKALPRRRLVRENGGDRRLGRAASTPSNGETMHILPFRRRT